MLTFNQILSLPKDIRKKHRYHGFNVAFIYSKGSADGSSQAADRARKRSGAADENDRKMFQEMRQPARIRARQLRAKVHCYVHG